MVTGRMWGKDEIEWKDRSWRLMENRSQRETDNWLIGGSVAGVSTALLMARRGRLPLALSTFNTTMGGAAIGSFAGMAGFIISQPLLKRDSDAAKKTAKEIVNSF